MNVDVGRRNRTLLVVLIAVPLGMALFAFFAFTPLYRLWCQVTGTAMRPNNEAAAAAPSAGTGRFVQVYFQSQVFDGLPLKFWCDRREDRVEVGRDGMATFYLENPTAETIRIRPIHQVSPINATPHFGLKVCFCFNDQDIPPGAKLEFPVVYTFAPAMDERVGTATLCYSLFRIGDGIAPSAEMLRIEAEVKDHGTIVSPRPTP